MKIKLDKVSYNPFRDTDLDPINKKQVDKLAKSIGAPRPKVGDDTLGFWGGLAVREVIGTHNKKTYQLAFGHHRFEALKQMGWKEADLNIVQYSDLQMVKAMATENATQRRGTAATLDSVAGAIRVLGYELVSGGNLSKIFDRSTETAKGMLLKGNGLGEPIITRFFDGTISEGDIRAATKALKTNGKMAEALDEILTRVEEHKKAVALAAKKAKDEEEKARLAEELEAAEQAEQDARKATKSINREVTLHPGIADLFPATYTFKQVVEVLTSERGQDFIPVEEQPRVCQELIDFITEDLEEQVTGKIAGAQLNRYMSNAGEWINQQRTQERKTFDKFTKVWDRATDYTQVLSNDLNEIISNLENETPPPFTPEDLKYYIDINTKSLRDSLDALALLSEKADSIVKTQ